MPRLARLLRLAFFLDVRADASAEEGLLEDVALFVDFDLDFEFDFFLLDFFLDVVVSPMVAVLTDAKGTCCRNDSSGKAGAEVLQGSVVSSKAGPVPI